MKKRCFIAMASLTLMVVAVEAQTTRVQWQRGTDFTKYQTYAWTEGTHVDDDANHRVIMEYVDAQLGINGIFTDEEEPDLYVAYHASATQNFQLSGGYSHDWSGTSPITAKDYLSGTLVVDLIDAKGGNVIWRATATASVVDDPAKNRGTVEKALEKMFADFPPG